MSNRLVDNEEVEINVERGDGGGNHHDSPARRDDNDVGILTLSDSVTNSSLQGGDTPLGTDVAATGDLGDGGLEEVSTYGNSYLPRSRFTGPTV